MSAGVSDGRRWLIVTIAVYLAGLAVAVASDRLAFLPKEILLPLLFVPPALSARLAAFWRDWAPFLGLVLLYDALRGLVYAAITAYGLPVYMGYAISSERWLLAGRTGPEWLQAAWIGRTDALDAALTAVHASHFFVFFAFGAIVWFWRPERFAAFERGMLGVLGAGLLGYLLVPTVPPWMADTGFGVLPPIARPFMDTYDAVIPNLVSQFDLNPIAAMPSLHCAIPTFMALFAAGTFGVRAWPLWTYAALVFVGVVYGGEHYVVDVLAGLALGAAAAAWVVRRPPTRALGGATTGECTALFVMLLAGSLLLGALGQSIRAPWTPSDAFIARELVPGSPNERYLRARNALARGDREQCLAMLEALPRSGVFDAPARLEVEALLGLGRAERALERLAEAAPPPEAVSEHLYWQTLAEAQLQRLDGARLEAVLARLAADTQSGGAHWARLLAEASRQGFRP